MKIPILVFGCLLVLAVSAWCLKAALAFGGASSIVPIVEAKGPLAWGDAPRDDPPASKTAAHSSGIPDVQQMASPAVRAEHEPGGDDGIRNKAMPSAGKPSAAVLAAAGSHATVPGTSGRQAAPATTGTLPQTAVMFHANPAAAELTPLVLDPGIPVAAALATPQGNPSPVAAAALQHLADSFVQDANAALNQSGITDAAASDSYYRSLDKANEQYRAIYGDAAYNTAGMQVAIDANTGN